jgi:hypothetical protein
MHNFKRLVAIATVSVNGEVMVKGGYPPEPEALHHSKAGAIDDREVLIWESLADSPSGFEIGSGNGFDDNHSTAQSFPKSLGDPTAQPVPEQ